VHAPNREPDVAVTFRVDRALDVVDDDDDDMSDPSDGGTVDDAGGDGKERRVRVVGDSDALGGWDVSLAPQCVRASSPSSSSDGATTEQHCVTVRLPLDSTVGFKLVTVDDAGETVRWSPGGEITFTTPKRCATGEVRCEWPVDDERMTVAVNMMVEMSSSDNKVETGGAWLAYGKSERDAHVEARRVEKAKEERARNGGGAGMGMDDDDDDDDDNVYDVGATMDEGDADVLNGVMVSTDEDDEVGFAANATGDEEDFELTEFTPGDHVEEMMGGLNTEIVFNAASEDDFGVRIAILEEGEIVELWHEHGTEPGKGMRVGDIYIGTVSKVISGMQGVLVDLTGRGPPYALMQKGIESPALAWRETKPPERSEADDERASAPQVEEPRRWNRGGGWGDLWADDVVGREPVATSAKGAQTTTSGKVGGSRLTGGGKSGGEGGVWRGVGGRSQRSSRLTDRSKMLPYWEPWKPDIALNHVEETAVESSSDESDETGEDESDESDGVSAKVTRRKLREECFSLWEPGQPVVVQVTRLGSGHKGPRVTARPTLPGRNVVLCPDGEGVYVSRKLMGPARKYVKAIGNTVCPDGSALIMRTEAAGVSKETLELDISCLASDWSKIKEASIKAVERASAASKAPPPQRLLQAATREQVLVRDLFGERIAKLIVDTPDAYKVIVDDLRRTGASQEIIDRVVLHEGDEPVFKALGVDEVVETMMNTERVPLGPELSGAHIVIQHTEALTAIDVNAGRTAMEAGESGDEIALRVNIAAAKLVARILRLRDIGGLVMVDLIDMGCDEHRREVEDVFEAVACRDRAQVTFVPISALGVMEVARERLQTHAFGKAAVIADEKGMPIQSIEEKTFNPKSSPAPRKVRVKGPRPPPWERGGRGRGRGRGGGGAPPPRNKAFREWETPPDFQR
jgi:Rne/Rng family ribonuclease